MAGVPWRRVNLTDQPIIVEGQNLPPYSIAIWSNCNRGSFGPTKTKSRYRILPLDSTLVAVLNALKASTESNGPDDLVFGTGKTPISYDVSLRKLKKAGKQAGIEVSWHDLRRFFANISDQIGMPEADRQYMMGHSSAAMTRHYTTTPAIERIRPYIEQITRALLAVGVTKTVTS
jgi:integrase